MRRLDPHSGISSAWDTSSAIAPDVEVDTETSVKLTRVSQQQLLQLIRRHLDVGSVALGRETTLQVRTAEIDPVELFVRGLEYPVALRRYPVTINPQLYWGPCVGISAQSRRS